MYTHAQAPGSKLQGMAKWRTKRTAAAAAGGGRTSTEGIVEKGADKPPAPPAEEVVVSVPLHCDGCSRKLRRSLLRFHGIEEATVEYSSNTVVVRGRMEDPMKVVEVIEKRTGKKALLLNPAPPEKLPPPSSAKREEIEQRDDDLADDLDMEMVVVLRIELHCDACSGEMQRRILNIKGVEEAVPDMKSSRLTVKGTVEPATLVGFIYKCTGRRPAIVRAESLNSPPEAAATATAPLTDLEIPADANAVQQDQPSDNLEEQNEGAEEEKNKGVGGEENGDEKTMEETKMNMANDASTGVTEETHIKDHLFKLPMAARVVGVIPDQSKKMAVSNTSGCYYQYHPAAYPYAYPQYAYQQPCDQCPYASNNPAMYRPCYPHYSPQAFSDENPDAGCTIM